MGLYHHLTQGNPSSLALPVLLFYRSTQAPTAKLAFNAPLRATLPSGYPTDVTQGYSGINGNGQVTFMRVMYDEVSPMHRLSVIFHEYLHVVQINKCGDSKNNQGPAFSLWLWEGAAMATENLYLDYNFISQNDDGSGTTGVVNQYYNDPLFKNEGWSAVKWTINHYLVAGWRMSSAEESYPATNNYNAEGAAVVYLCSRTSYKYAKVDFLNNGDCDMTKHGTKDASFATVFGTGSSYGTGWTSVADFYAEFNAWLATNPDPATLKPTAAQLKEVFSHATICSDLCATASNGVCDASCLHGSDCSDCGSAPKPAAFPITFRVPTAVAKTAEGNCRQFTVRQCLPTPNI